MALSPFTTSQSPLNRSRSSSCSSPVRNRVVYQEVFSIGANTLVRSYSCDQVFDKDGSGRTFQTTQIQVSSFITPEKKIHVKPDESKQKEPRRLILEHPTKKTDVRNDSTKYLKGPNVAMTAFRKAKMFTFLTITSACALYFYLSFRECSFVWDLEKTEFELKENIFGQNQALEKINSVLKISNRTNNIHIMVFSGSVGVGKTYSSSIISRNFPEKSQKLITYTEFFKEDVEKLLTHKLSVCGCNLIIVDDLSVNSVREALNLILLLKNKRLNENLLIILIFQTHTATESSRIFGEFNSAFLNVHHILFEPLTKDEVEKCFRFEIQRHGVIIPNLELKRLVEDKMSHIDISKGPSGCKGVDVEVASYFKKTVNGLS